MLNDFPTYTDLIVILDLTPEASARRISSVPYSGRNHDGGGVCFDILTQRAPSASLKLME